LSFVDFAADECSFTSYFYGSKFSCSFQGTAHHLQNIIQQIFPPGDEKTSIEYFSLKANYCSSITIICFMIYVSFWKNLGHFWLFNRSIFQLKLTQTKQVSFFSFS